MQDLGPLTLGQLARRAGGTREPKPRSLPERPHGVHRGGARRQAGFAELVEEAAALMRRLRALAAQVSGSGTLSAGPRKLVRDLQRLGPRTVPQLARARSVSRQHVQALVSQLAHGGYVEFAANPAHRRSPLVRLTRRGEEQSAEMRRQEAELLDSLEIALEGDELLRAAAVLRVVREAVERRTGRGTGRGDAATAANSDA